jgi:chloramphenicol O-acetyltransferase type A
MAARKRHPRAQRLLHRRKRARVPTEAAARHVCLPLSRGVFMAEHIVDLATWPRSAQFRWFRTYERPHYAITCRLDTTTLMTRGKARGVSVYRACLYAIGAGLHAVPELNMRFRGETVVRHDRVMLSMTVPRPDGSFGYGYVPYDPDFSRFDAEAAARIDAARLGTALAPNDGSDDAVAYLSCLPWLDFTSLDNALPHAEDCIPRVAWGKILRAGDGWQMAMSIQVHHALVDGAHLGAYFSAVQEALDRV